MDTLDKTARSKRMSLIRGKNTKPELVIRKLLHGAGFRYRLHNKHLPGKPDLTLRKYNVVIFIHGCFWHGHNCHIAHIPKSNVPFWQNKISTNAQRDANRLIQLQEQGWRTLTIWECALLGKAKLPESKILSLIRMFIENPQRKTATIR